MILECRPRLFWRKLRWILEWQPRLLWRTIKPINECQSHLISKAGSFLQAHPRYFSRAGKKILCHRRPFWRRGMPFHELHPPSFLGQECCYLGAKLFSYGCGKSVSSVQHSMFLEGKRPFRECQQSQVLGSGGHFL
jgi:hypothetical protein